MRQVPLFCVQVDGVMPVQVRHLESNTKKVVETLNVTLSLDTDTFHWKAGIVGWSATASVGMSHWILPDDTSRGIPKNNFPGRPDNVNWQLDFAVTVNDWTIIETKVQGCNPLRSHVGPFLIPVMLGATLVESEQAGPVKPVEHAQTELVHVPWPEQIGCPGQKLDTIWVSTVVMFVETIVTVRVRLNVVMAVAMLTLSDCLTANMQADRKLSTRPCVAMSGLPVKNKSSLQLVVIVCRACAANGWHSGKIGEAMIGCRHIVVACVSLNPAGDGQTIGPFTGVVGIVMLTGGNIVLLAIMMGTEAFVGGSWLALTQLKVNPVLKSTAAVEGGPLPGALQVLRAPWAQLQMDGAWTAHGGTGRQFGG
jgi:hypothetical protein